MKLNVEVDLKLDDVIEFIDWEATKEDKRAIRNALNDLDPSTEVRIKTLHDEMKKEILDLAFNKFTLDELESKLGTKFELM